MEQAGVQLVAQGANAFGADLKGAEKAVTDFVQGAERGGGRVGAAGQVMIGALREVGAIAVQALGQAARATADFLKDSVDKAGDFQAGMKEFQAVAGKGVDTKGLEQFHDLFIQLGKDLPVSTADVQQAAIELVKGGIDPATIAAGGLRQSIQFAAAAMGGDLAAAAEVSAKVVGGWAAVGATATDKANLLTQATDLLTKAANASTVDVHDLALGLYNVQGTAKTTGLSLQETTTALAELAPRFANANTAGTSFRNFLVRLQPTTQPAIDAMTNLGLYTEETGSAFFDAEGKFIGVAKASQILHDVLGPLNDAQRAQALQTIFGNDAMNAAAAFAEMGAQGYTDMAGALENANGVAENAALKQDGYNIALENAKGSVEALQISLGERLLPVLTDLLNNTITPAINTLGTFADAVTGDKEALSDLSPTMQGLVGTVQALGAHIQDMVDWATHVSNAFDLWQSGTVSLRTALDTILPGLGNLAPTIEAVGGFIQDTLVPAVQDVAGWLGDHLPQAIQTVSDFWTGTLQPALLEVGGVFQDQIIPIISDLAETVWPVLNAALEVGASFWTNVLQPVLESTWKMFKNDILPILAEVASWLKEHVPPAVQTLADFLSNTLFPAFHTVWDFLDKNIMPIFKALADVAIALLKKEIEALTGLWQNVLLPALQKAGDWIDRTLGPILKNFTDWLGDVTGGVDGISKAAQGLISWLGDLATKISNLSLPDWLTPGSPTPWEIALRGLADAVGGEVVPSVDDFAGKLSTLGQAAVSVAKATTEQLGAAIKGFGQALAESSQQAVESMQGATEQIGNVLDQSSLISAVKGFGADVMAGLISGIKSKIGALKSVIESTASTVTGAFQDAFGIHSPSTVMAEEVGEPMVLGWIQGILDAMPQLLSAIGDAGEDIVRQAQDIADSVSEALSSGFTATASVNRQKVKNLQDIEKVAKGMQGGVQLQLEMAEKEAQKIADPQQRAAYFKQRSQQIFELAKLQEQINEAQQAGDRDRYDALVAQYQLINAAQLDESKALDVQRQAGSSLTDLIKQISDLLSNEAINAADGPGGLINVLKDLLGYATGLYSPPVTDAEMAAGGTSYSSAVTYNMPIYTNQTPAVLRQSMAIVGATMP